MSKSETDKHVEKLVASKYHDNGGCVVRHPNAQQTSCKYPDNGYNITRGPRKKFYNHPRYKATEIHKTTQKEFEITICGKLFKFRSPQHPSAGQDDVWDVDKYGNFDPQNEGKAGKYPYPHQWHHMIPSNVLLRELYDKKHEYKLLELLMHGKYNLNGERNVVLLPSQFQVGELINWPHHCGSHPGYDAFTETKLTSLKEQLLSLLGNKEVCEVNKELAEGSAEDVNKISDNLFDILEKAGGGLSINDRFKDAI